MSNIRKDGWQPIETAPRAEGTSILAFDGERVGEAVPYDDWSESNDEAVRVWRWANDSCSCCWYTPERQPTHWMPMPEAPALPHPQQDGEA